MKRELKAAAFLLLLGLPPGKGAAQNPPAPGGAAQALPTTTGAALTYQPFGMAQEMIDLSAGGVEAELVAQHAAPARRGAPSKVQRRAFRLPTSLNRRPVWGVVGRSVGVASYDRLWLDWNGDRRVQPNEHSEGSQEGALVRFGPIRRPGQAADVQPFYLIVHENTHVHLVPAGRFEGELKLGTRAVRVAVVDANVNGVEGESGVLGQEGDLLLLDLNGDGKFTGVSEDWMAHPWDLETVPLRRVVEMPDGVYYQLMVSRNGDRISAAPDPRPTGRVRVHADRFAMEVVSGDDRIWVRSAGGEAVLPVGSYIVPWVVLGAADGDRGFWTASVLPQTPGQERGRLRIEAGMTADYTCGPPFRAVLGARGGGRHRVISVSLRDQVGNPVTEILTPDGRRPAEPEVRLTDAAGRVVKVGRLPYGPDFRCSANWTLPGPGGALRMAVDWPLGPFSLSPPDAAASGGSTSPLTVAPHR